MFSNKNESLDTILIDTDAGADDLLAIMLAVLSPRIEVKGIVASYGIYSVEEAIRRVEYLLDQLPGAENIPIFKGSPQSLKHGSNQADIIHGRTHLDSKVFRQGRPQNLRGVLDLFKKPIVYVSLGPLTNLAKLLEMGLETKKELQILCLGGSLLCSGNASSLAEANFYVDPAAAKQVLLSGVPIKLIPLNMTQNLIWIPELLSGSYSTLINEFIGSYIKFYSSVLDTEEKPLYQGAILHDPLAIISIIEPQVLRYTKKVIALDLIEQVRGFIYPVFRLEHKHQIEKNNRTELLAAENLDENLFWDTFKKTLSS